MGAWHSKGRAQNADQSPIPRPPSHLQQITLAVLGEREMKVLRKYRTKAAPDYCLLELEDDNFAFYEWDKMESITDEFNKTEHIGKRLGTTWMDWAELAIIEALAGQAEVIWNGESGSEPKNNDGRSDCFWCHGTLKESQGWRFGTTYHVCNKCGK
jgi:hypothetical protein